ncbi:MAG: VOC family protein [Proteobacteria bacterium]|nr:VOC family protein [Pseudomonadota bacterium]
MINRIDIVSIPVADQKIAKQFYQDLLGFELVRENPMGPGQTWVQLGLPGAETSITLVTWFDSMPPGSVQGLVIDTDDAGKTHAQLIEKGLEISDLQDAPWGKFATFTDPDGNGWVLQQAA